MANLTKRQSALREYKSESNSIYSLSEAVSILKKASTELPLKFDESVEVSIMLGIDPRKPEQNIRSAIVLPHGTGKKVRVAVVAQDAHAQSALEAGADKVGLDDLVEEIKQASNIPYDVIIATPDSMKVLSKIGQILGPRGLMPNPKVGTVTNDVASAVRNAKMGQIRYRNDKSGIVHSAVGKVSFEAQHLVENIVTLVQDIKRLKPSSSKGVYLKKIYIASTMGFSLAVDVSTCS